jgi:hypothetical protein
MFANHFAALMLSGSHRTFCTGKCAIHLEYCRFERPAKRAARKGNGADKCARAILFNVTPEDVKVLHKSFGCCHLKLSKSPAVSHFTDVIISEFRLP